MSPDGVTVLDDLPDWQEAEDYEKILSVEAQMSGRAHPQGPNTPDGPRPTPYAGMPNAPMGG